MTDGDVESGGLSESGKFIFPHKAIKVVTSLGTIALLFIAIFSLYVLPAPIVTIILDVAFLVGVELLGAVIMRISDRTRGRDLNFPITHLSPGLRGIVVSGGLSLVSRGPGRTVRVDDNDRKRR